MENMPDIMRNGYKYTVYIRPWLKGDRRFECIRYKPGMRKCTWERVDISEYRKVRDQKSK
jgi:hypothetical protein